MPPDLEKNGAGKATGVDGTAVSSANGLQGASLAVSIIQKDWEDDGERRVLDCGEFTIDTISFRPADQNNHQSDVAAGGFLRPGGEEEQKLGEYPAFGYRGADRGGRES